MGRYYGFQTEQARVGQTIFESRLLNGSFRREFTAALTAQLVAHNYEAGYAADVAARWVRWYGLTPINRVEA